MPFKCNKYHARIKIIVWGETSFLSNNKWPHEQVVVKGSLQNAVETTKSTLCTVVVIECQMAVLPLFKDAH